MNNLYNLARNGLSVAQAALRVTGDNLTNGVSHAYSRRSMIIGELGGMSTQTGFYGFGAQVNGIERAYDSFANNQLRGAISQYSFLNGRMEQLADIDNMLADESDNVSVSLGNLFKAMSTLSTAPEDAAARSAVFNSLGSLASRYNASGKRLSGLEKSTNTQIEQSVKDLNSYTKQLAEINKQLERAQGPASHLQTCWTAAICCWKRSAIRSGLRCRRTCRAGVLTSLSLTDARWSLVIRPTR